MSAGHFRRAPWPRMPRRPGIVDTAVTRPIVLVSLTAASGGGVLAYRRSRHRRRWAGAVQEWNRLRHEVVRAETDPALIIFRARLADVRDPRSAAFWHSFAVADNAFRDAVPARSGEVRDFESAVQIAWAAWSDVRRPVTVSPVRRAVITVLRLALPAARAGRAASCNPNAESALGIPGWMQIASGAEELSIPGRCPR